MGKKNINIIILAFILINHSFSFQFAEQNNQSLSILTFVPVIEDDGKYLTCRAENPSIPDSALEDKWRLNVYCKYKNFFL